LNAKWALMADIGWQNWSQFGKADVAVDSSTGLLANAQPQTGNLKQGKHPAMQHGPGALGRTHLQGGWRSTSLSYILALVPAVHDVINCPRILSPQLARHGAPPTSTLRKCQ